MVCVLGCVCYMGECMCLKCLYIIYEIHTKLSIFCGRGSLLTDGTHTISTHTWYTVTQTFFSTAQACCWKPKYRRCCKRLVIVLLAVSFYKPEPLGLKMFYYAPISFLTSTTKPADITYVVTFGQTENFAIFTIFITFHTSAILWFTYCHICQNIIFSVEF